MKQKREANFPRIFLIPKADNIEVIQNDITVKESGSNSTKKKMLSPAIY